MKIECNQIDLGAPELEQNNYERFYKLDRDRKLTLNNWFEMVWKMREHPVSEHFLGFELTYGLLDQIGRVISTTGSDEKRFAALQGNIELQHIFDTMMDEPKSLMRMYAKRFAALWPIFDTTIRDSKPKWDTLKEGNIRSEIINRYSANGYKSRPSCWVDHVAADPKVLPDWKHTMTAWYTVHLNMTGPEWNHSESDVRIYSNGFLSLLYFFKEGKIFFENPSLKPDIFERTQVLSSL